MSSAEQLRIELTEALAPVFSESPDTAVYLALSGGMDSRLMLDCIASRPEWCSRVMAIHVNHGLSRDADLWQQECQRYCEACGVSFIGQKVTLEYTGQGTEAAARDARYAAFEQLLPPHALLLTAHHGSDQAETLLLRLFRGSGLAGLKGMSPSRKLTRHSDDKRTVVRPWLGFTREQLALAARGLSWIEDDSNRDQTFDRNWMRHSLMPLLQVRYPAVESTLIETTQHLSADYYLLMELLTPVLNSAVSECDWPATAPFCLSVEAVLKQPSRVRFHQVRYWLEKNGLPVPQGKKVWHWLEQALNAGPDRHPSLRFDGVVLQRFRQHLYVWSEQKTPDSVDCIPVTWGRGTIAPSANSQPLPEGWSVSPTRQCASKVLSRVGQQTKSLKNVWQEKGVPVWLRDDWPMLIYAGEIVAALGLVNDCSLKCEPVDILSLKWRRGAIWRETTE
ncbi:MAG: tRNA(Ile)-lysidine synthetase [Thalassolituus sp.]|nr:MAG: tRNA(Ile)-lysidine synthetase [Thalassolituus sp.]